MAFTILFYFNEDFSRINVIEMFKVKYQNINAIYILFRFHYYFLI